MSRPRFTQPSLLPAWALCAILVALGAVFARAQDDAKAKATAAIEAYKAVADEPFAKKAKAIAALGALADNRVLSILERELLGTKTAKDRVVVLNAMGAAVRPRIVGAVFDVMASPHGSREVYAAGASCLARQGNRGIDSLRALAQDPPDTVPSGSRGSLRAECVKGLAAANDTRAWRALAAISLEGSARDRLPVLQLLVKAPSDSIVTRARQDAVRSSDVTLATVALAQLVAAGDGSRRLVEDTWQRFQSQPISDLAGAAFTRAMVAELAPALFDDLLRASSGAGRQVRQALRDVAKQATADVEFVRFLVEDGLHMPSPERDAARLWLRHADPKVAKKELAQLRDNLRTIRADDAETVRTLHPIFASDPTWVEDLLRVANARAWELEAMGLTLLADVEARAGLEIAQDALDHERWQVRAAAFAFCGRVRDLSTIPMLIARLDDEKGRLREDLLDALQDLTGYRFLQTNRWERFWREDGEGFKMPPPRERKRRSTADGNTKGFFNIPVVSDRVAFVIDVSGSMSAKIGTDGKRTRISEAKRQLCIAVDAMAGNRFFNVIVYGTNVDPLSDRLVKATDANKADMTSRVKALKLRGATNIHGALETAFADPDVDTIFLLTDGQPSAGRIVDQDELADEVARWNLSRRVVIHTVSIGNRSKLMQRLADESGGSFVHVR